MTKLLVAARELFGRERFGEVLGELWLVHARLMRSINGGVPMEVALRRWEDQFRRCSEEGRYREGRNGPRRRVARFSELDERGGPDLSHHVRRAF